MTEQHTDPNIDNLLGGMDPGIASLIGAAPPPPPSALGHIEIPTFSSKEAKAAERALDRSADQFAQNRIGKTYMRKFGALAQAIPGADRIRVRKRRDSANLGFVGEWNFRDLQSTNDLEAFIARYVKPKHGPGEYDITIIDSMGKEFPAGSVFIEGEPIDGARGEGGMVDLVREVMQASRQSAAPQEDPIAAMRRAAQFAEELKKQNGGGSDPMSMMMMMQAMAPKPPPGPDPMLLSVLERLAAKVEKIEQAGSMAPLAPLPPPPPEKPAVDWIALGSTVVLPLLQMMQASQQSNLQMLMAATQSKDTMSTKDMLMLMQEQQARAAAMASQDKLSTRDVIELMQRKSDEGRPQNTIEDQMEAMVKMKEFATAFAPAAPPGPQGASFWDALVALASSQDVAGAISDRLRSQRQQQIEPAPALPERSGAQVIRMPPRQPSPVAQIPQQASAPQQIPLPDHLKDDCAKITMAGDAASRVGATVETLFSLQKSPDFKPFVMALLEATAKNETEKTLHGLGRWLHMLSENGLLTRETALLVIGDFKENWDMIRAMLLERLPFLRQFAGATPIASPQPPAAPAAPAAPLPQSDPEIPSDVDLSYGTENELAEPAVL
jgi:hypothetical protein